MASNSKTFSLIVLFIVANLFVCRTEAGQIRNSTHVLLALAQSPVPIAPEPFLKSPKITSFCQGCSLRRAELEKTLTEDEINSLRIQRVKQQILNKLRLKEPPKVAMAFSALPKPLTRGSALHQSSTMPEDDGNMVDVDDFYGKTNQVVLFPQPNGADGKGCGPSGSGTTGTTGSAACFTFELPAGLESDTVTTAQLWLYKRSSDGTNHAAFLVSEVISDSFSTDSKAITTYRMAAKEVWFKIDLARTVKDWLRLQDGNASQSHTISVACETCAAAASPVGQIGGQRPFLVINTSTAGQRSRTKRHVNCSPGMSECCREKLYISFADIGWDDWILQPSGYDAYYCRGSCSSAASLTLSGSHYNTIIRKFLRESTSERSVELVPCCTPTRLASLQLLYVDNNQTITQQTLPNMVVSSCGCM